MSSGVNPKERLAAIVEHQAHLLPAQGPIGVFIHQNTLHAFQHLPFERAVTEAAKLYGTEPYMTAPAFREAIDSGRIRPEDIDTILSREPETELWPGGPATRQLRRAMLLPGVREFWPETIDWEMREGGTLGHFRLDLPPAARAALSLDTAAELFGFCLANTAGRPETAGRPMRPRDGVLAATGIDIDDLVRPLTIKLCGAFLDQGLAFWTMPYRAEGFWRASRRMLSQPPAMEARGLRRLAEFARMAATWDRTEAVMRFLELLGVGESEWESVIQAELLALPGWAGLMRQLEAEPELAPHEPVPASVMDFLAVRLMLTTAATASATGESRDWRHEQAPATDPEAARLARAAAIFDALQLAGLSSRALSALAPGELQHVFQAIENFGDWERRLVLHLAYEERHARQILLPLERHRGQSRIDRPGRMAAQAIFCIDEREESIRRHLEETDPAIETLGSAGFFSVAMHYTGIDDAHGAALCPVVVKPRHAVTERPVHSDRESYGRRRALRKLLARNSRNWLNSSRTMLHGWLGSAGLGLFTIFPLAGRVLNPLRYGRLVKWLNDAVVPQPRTELAFMREHSTQHAASDGFLQGFEIDERVERVAAVLGTAGLRSGLARLVVVLGHGSTSLNNPHESAHDCGACGGRRGGPNGRLLAAMANHPDVRTQLRGRGISIPDDTWFVGGYHDTCNDDVDLFDVETVPPTHAPDLTRVRAALDRARALSAHERARRFEAAAWGIDAAAGLQHVQERAEHLAEPRPEYGHCTNAVCIVGRRSTTRGLFLDRRAFLVSYDAAQDPNDSSLAALLGAVIPVCGGISLEYYFSFVDNEGYGCGTKLPHNVTGLMGVMNGYESDLRTGLPWQMVEIHEPVRLLFVVETSAERVVETVRKNPLLWEFLVNRWIRLAVLDPAGGPPLLYRDGAWEPVEGDDEGLPVAGSSADWYAGKREHLPVARIASRNAPAAAA